MAQNTKTPVMVLQELTVKRGLAPPDYQIEYCVQGTHQNRFDFVVNVAEITARGTGSSKQIAKHQAAHNALMMLKDRGIYIPSENPVSEFGSVGKDGTTLKSALNCIMDLQNICIENKIPAPQWIEISSAGPPHAKEFAYECKISSITTEAKANTKKMAKQLSAQKMLERIKDVLPELITEEDDSIKKLTEKDAEAIFRYNDFREVIPDKSVKIADVPQTLAKLMQAKNLKYEDFQEDLKIVSEESLKKILDQLEVGYEIRMFQSYPPIALLILKIDTSFVSMGRGKTAAEAVSNALTTGFRIMDCFMQIKL